MNIAEYLDFQRTKIRHKVLALQIEILKAFYKKKHEGESIGQKFYDEFEQDLKGELHELERFDSWCRKKFFFKSKFHSLFESNAKERTKIETRIRDIQESKRRHIAEDHLPKIQDRIGEVR